ncbi:hypothetical protein [Actinoallomurus soli]|uniref:hypothetical protein n=1 Tax=Actinoallomurus soli TaxID=2952535 RepID=UPI002093808B|nr:hypothetical protein [Actinoallomurus soli]MCO5973078.1 hypothetical protein [Actinoallomurus soli]
MNAVDRSRITDARAYDPVSARAAVDALRDPRSAEHAARAVANLRYAVSNDHAGTLYPAAVPATALLLEVIADQPGPARMEALYALLDWWGCFVADPECGIHDDPERGLVDVREGVVERVRAAADMLRRVAKDPSAGGHHRPVVRELLQNLDAGWDRGDI